MLTLKVRNGPRGFGDGEQVAAVYPFALVQGVVDFAGCYYCLGLGQLPGGLSKRLFILVFLPVEAGATKAKSVVWTRSMIV